jgi:hypothetical protein
MKDLTPMSCGIIIKISNEILHHPKFNKKDATHLKEIVGLVS